LNLTDIKRQRGAALITSLVIVLVISILGVGIARQVIAQRKVSSSQYDQIITFVNAESGMQEAEAVINENTPQSLSVNAASPLVVTINADNNWWKTTANWVSGAVATDGVNTLDGTPTYLIEDAGIEGDLDVSSTAPKRHFFRVTAKAKGAADGESFLQSHYAIWE